MFFAKKLHLLYSKNSPPTFKTIKYFSQLYKNGSDELKRLVKKEIQDSRFKDLPVSLFGSTSDFISLFKLADDGVINFEDNQIKSLLESIFNGKSEFNELIQIAKNCKFSNILNICDVILRTSLEIIEENSYVNESNYNQLKSELESNEIKIFDFSVKERQISALCTIPEKFEVALKILLHFNLNDSLNSVFNELLRNYSRLYYPSPVKVLNEKIKENNDLLERYLKIIQRYVDPIYQMNLYQMNPKKYELDKYNKFFQTVVSLFKDKRGLNLFKLFYFKYINEQSQILNLISI